jgi:hypothetical protein
MLDYSVLNEVIFYIMKYKKKLDNIQVLSAPEFDKKIKFNGLGSQVSALFKVASYQLGAI